MEDKDYILFEKYLRGDLSDADVLIFKNRLVTDTEFKNSFTTYTELSGFLEHTLDDESMAFKNNLKNIAQAHFSKTETSTPEESNKRYTFGRLAIAASIVVLIGLFVFNQFKTPTYNDYNTHDTIDLTVRGANDNELFEANKAFNTREFSKANSILERLLETDKDNRQLQLYYAVTNIELDRFEVADILLNDISKSASVYKNRALWYFALSNLKQDKIEETQLVLKQIPEDADDYKQAQKLLNKLK